MDTFAHAEQGLLRDGVVQSDEWYMLWLTGATFEDEPPSPVQLELF